MKSDFLTNLFFRALQTVSIATMLVRAAAGGHRGCTLSALAHCPQSGKAAQAHGGSQDRAKSLSEMLKENRTRCKMTQEFVAETIGVSRQAVSKWENGTSEPNTSTRRAAGLAAPGRAGICSRGVESALEAREKIITTPPAAPPYPPRSAWGNGSCGLFRCGAL